MVQGVANRVFRNESYITKKFNISAFQNCFSYFHWNVVRDSRTLWTFSFSSDQLYFQTIVDPVAYTLGVPLYRLVRRVSLNSLTDRAAQTKCSETCYIPLKSWEFQLFRHVSLIFIEISSENLQEIEVNTFQRPIPEINRLKFPKYDLILPWYRG